jgi:hypothetical protein
MTLPDEFPTDIDYAKYVQEANDMLEAIGCKPPVPYVSVVERFFALLVNRQLIAAWPLGTTRTIPTALNGCGI